MARANPSRDGWSKAITTFATVLMLSLGLCGINFFAVMRRYPDDHPNWFSRLLGFAAWTELAAIAISACGLLIAFVMRPRREITFLPPTSDGKDEN